MSFTYLNLPKITARQIAQEIERTVEENELSLRGAGLEFVTKLKTDKDCIAFDNIDHLKDVAISLNATLENSGAEYCNTVSDRLFTIETDYQAYHGLDGDNWDKISA